LKKSVDKYKNEFLKSLKELRGYSDLTVKSYDESIKEAFLHMEIVQNSSGYVFELMPYRIKISQQNPKTISKKLSAIRTFVKFLNDEKAIAVVLKDDDSIKVAKTLPKPISHKHIMEAFEKADLKEKLVVAMLYTLGLRISELCNVEIKDISDEWIRVMGKGSKHRDVPFVSTTKRLISEYLQKYMPKRYLFEKDGEKLSENSLRYTVTKVFKRVALRVTPHQLRHSYASSLLNGGAPITDVSELLGHSSIATTQIYTRLGSALKQQNYNMAHPLCGADKQC